MTIDYDRLVPDRLKEYDLPVLLELAAGLKNRMLDVCAKSGGHIGALHVVFDTPDDHIVWDVGHQAYAHKLLTGRFGNFETLRQKGGVSGFLNRSESPYDAFGAGHASTSISAAQGMAEAFRHAGQDRWAIAVIGDGSLTGGLAFEALNQVGYRQSPVLIIFNDNGLSIDENVGALNERFVAARQAGDATPMAQFFESFSLAYDGFHDGHDLPFLLTKLSEIKRARKRPLVLHLVTQKGKGYEPAEREPIKFHGLGPFDLASGKVVQKPAPPSYTEIFAATLIDLAKRDPKLFAVTAAMPSGTGLRAFARALPEQFYDVGIAEQHAVLMAAGMATQGARPMVAIYSTFLQRAYDQIIHDVCIQNLPVAFALDRGGLVGNDGATHQGVFDFSYLRCLPNMVVMAPKDENEFQHMVYTAHHYQQGPIAFRYPRGPGWGVAMDGDLRMLPIGKGELLLDTDKPELTLFAIGQTVMPSLRAAERLSQEGIKVCVVNARFVKPLDTALVDYTVKRSVKVITVEENAAMGGFGSAVLEYLSAASYAYEIKRLAVPDHFIEHATQAEQREECGLDEASIYQEAMAFLRRDHALTSLSMR